MIDELHPECQVAEANDIKEAAKVISELKGQVMRQGIELRGLSDDLTAIGHALQMGRDGEDFTTRAICAAIRKLQREQRLSHSERLKIIQARDVLIELLEEK